MSHNGEQRERRRKLLSLDAFQESPVWCFADDMEHLVPSNFEGHLSEDDCPLFVRCELTTKGGRYLPGYIAADLAVYALGVLTENNEFTVHADMRELFPLAETGIRAAFEIPDDEPIFPMQYRSRYGYRGSPPLSGIFK